MMKKRDFSRFLIAAGLGVALLALSGCAAMGTRESGVRPQPVRIATIIQWSKEGMPPKDIIQKIRDSGTVYRFRADQFVRLHEEGVPYPVLNYMQAAYVDAVSRDRTRRYLRAWTPYDDGYYYGGVPFGWDEPMEGFGEDEGEGGGD